MMAHMYLLLSEKRNISFQSHPHTILNFHFIALANIARNICSIVKRRLNDSTISTM